MLGNLARGAVNGRSCLFKVSAVKCTTGINAAQARTRTSRSIVRRCTRVSCVNENDSVAVTRRRPVLSGLLAASCSGIIQNEGRASAMSTQAAADWVKEDKRRMLHAVYSVGDLDATIEYYKKCFGMKLLRYRDVPEEKFSNAFMGYGPETSNFSMELTKVYGVGSYDLGEGFGHFGLAIPDVYKACEEIKSVNGEITREAGQTKGGKSIIAFAKDPTGYSFELIQRPKTTEPLCQVMLRVGDLDRSIKFYSEVIGMENLRVRENPDYKYSLGFMGYGPEEDNTVMELTYNWGKDKYTKGDGYTQVAISTRDVYKTAEQIKACGGTLVQEAGPVPGIGTKICACVDPDGWRIVFVDEEDFLKELA